MKKVSIETKAMTLAYNCVVRIGWSHSRLSREYSITLPTLRRIREGRRGKALTDEYCMKVFLEIINQEFHEDLKQGGNTSPFFNNACREILFAQFEVGEVK